MYNFASDKLKKLFDESDVEESTTKLDVTETTQLTFIKNFKLNQINTYDFVAQTPNKLDQL